MSKLVYLQPCYVLHTRPYRETSLLVTLFSRDYGRVDAMARGVRRLKSPMKGLLQPFQALQVSWGGRHELVTLKDAELMDQQVALDKQTLVIGFYLNELLMRLLMPHDAHERLFAHYENLINEMQRAKFHETQLRQFERKLLSELGFGLNLDKDNQGLPITESAYYHYQPELGFSETKTANTNNHTVFQGQHLLAIAQDNLELVEIRHAAKRLMRLAMNHLLQYKPIRSRDMFIVEEKV